MSISQSFSSLISRIQPLASEVEAAKQHLATIQTRLETVFELSSCRRTGSFARGTSIRGFSDADLFAVFRKSNFTRAGSLISSSTVLNSVRQELVARYPNTPISRDVMAISVAFADGRHVDVVPALFDSMHQEKWPVYLMPDGVGGWMKTCPSIYDAYIEQANRASGGKLLYVAQMVKFWRECRSPRVPLSSFHIELVLASEETCKGVKSYGECVRDIFRSLATRGCRAMQDPFRIAGYIPAVKTEGQRESTLASVTYSRDHANTALTAELWQPAEARRQWGIVFNGKFPA